MAWELISYHCMISYCLYVPQLVYPFAYWRISHFHFFLILKFPLTCFPFEFLTCLNSHSFPGSVQILFRPWGICLFFTEALLCPNTGIPCNSSLWFRFWSLSSAWHYLSYILLASFNVSSLHDCDLVLIGSILYLQHLLIISGTQ